MIMIHKKEIDSSIQSKKPLGGLVVMVVAEVWLLGEGF